MSISLLGSISVCKVNTGYADKIQSDRFENPNNMMCPLWNGLDNYGRAVNPDSFYTKNAGCNSAEDRVMTENFLRPQYMEYVALDAAGFNNPTMFSNNPPTYGKRIVEKFMDTPSNREAMETNKSVQDYYNIVGSAGYQYRNTNTPYSDGTCGVQGGADCPTCSVRHGSKGKSLYEGFQDNRQSGF